MDDELEPKSTSFFPFFRWIPSSAKELQSAENLLIKSAKISSSYEGKYVDIGDINGTPVRIWTLILEGPKSSPPLVMIHGMAAGSALFTVNARFFSSQRTVILMDLPGFARSSRPTFSSDPQRVEEQYVEILEKWRQNLGLHKMILLGHSFGGYLVSAYTLKYSQSVEHLLLADPWGMPEISSTSIVSSFPWYLKSILFIAKRFNPLAILRAFGPLGPSLIQRVRPDLVFRFSKLFQLQNASLFTNYIYHCNAQSPTGESAFSSLTEGFAAAKIPMLPRLSDLNIHVPLTVMYGEYSWMTILPEEIYKQNLNSNHIYLKIHILQGASHHIYADNSEDFTRIVNEACEISVK